METSSCKLVLTPITKEGKQCVIGFLHPLLSSWYLGYCEKYRKQMLRQHKGHGVSLDRWEELDCVGSALVVLGENTTFSPESKFLCS